ncbi:MAG: hypothetical protein GXX93_08695 [Anaerolineae bacterium]|nr:hypothetical protein [Anaerolineae bacterium]
MMPSAGMLRLALISMAFGLWFMLTACALLLWRFLVGPPPQLLVHGVICSGMLSVAGILVSVAGCCVPQRQAPTESDQSGLDTPEA